MLKKFDPDFEILVLFATCNHEKGRGSGGLVVLLRGKTFKSKLIRKCANFIAFSAQHIATDEKYTCVFCYFPPGEDNNAATITLLSELCQDISLSCNNNVFIFGDLNAKIGYLNQLDDNLVDSSCINASRLTSSDELCTRGVALVDLLESYGFCTLNGRSISDSPANYTYVDKGCSIIDTAWVLIDCLNTVRDFVVGDKSVSDHLPCIICLDVCNPQHEPFDFAQQKKIKVGGNCIEFFQSSINSLPEPPNIEQFKANIISSCEMAGMYRYPYVKTDKVWFDSECRKAWLYMKECYSIMRSFPSDFTRQNVVASRKRYLQLVKLKKRCYYKSIQEKLGDCKTRSAFWSTIRMFRKKTGNMCPLTSAEWERFYDVEMPVRFLPDVYDDLPDCNVEELDKPFTMDELMKSLKMCSPNKAPGPDCIPNSVLKILPPSSLEVLLHWYTVHRENGSVRSPFGGHTNSDQYQSLIYYRALPTFTKK